MARPAKPATRKSKTDTSLTLTRSFDAAPEALFQAWIDPVQVARWIGPRRMTAVVEKMEAREGGSYRIAMHEADGTAHTVQGAYREFAPPARLVFTWAWLAESGKPGHESLVTIELRPIGKKTEMTLHHERFESKERRDSHSHGWGESFDKLAEALAGMSSRR